MFSSSPDAVLDGRSSIISLYRSRETAHRLVKCGTPPEGNVNGQWLDTTPVLMVHELGMSHSSYFSQNSTDVVAKHVWMVLLPVVCRESWHMVHRSWYPMASSSRWTPCTLRYPVAIQLCHLMSVELHCGHFPSCGKYRGCITVSGFKYMMSGLISVTPLRFV